MKGKLKNMREILKEEKKKWKDIQNTEYILSKIEVKKLFSYLEKQLEDTSCNHTLYYTEQWFKDNLPQEEIKNVMDEIKQMGGYCDCEVLMNCYEEYDID